MNGLRRVAAALTVLLPGLAALATGIPALATGVPAPAVRPAGTEARSGAGPVSLAGRSGDVGQATDARQEQRQRRQRGRVRARHHWRGPGGDPLPFTTHDEVIEFLSEAEVVRSEPVGSGTTAPIRVLLERDGVLAWAQFQDVDEEHERVRLGNGEYAMHLTDSYRNDCAAYEMARLLGIDNVPPMVPRRLGQQDGRLQLWLAGVFTEGERRARNRQPPRRFDWMARVQTMYLFDDVIGNVDRNMGNILLSEDFDMWLIDHTRAFQRRAEPRHLDEIGWVDRTVWERLRGLDRARVEERLGPYVSGFEIDAVMRRVEIVVRHVESLIETRGEDAVLVDVPRNGSAPR